MRYFKVLDENGRSARDQEWPLPEGEGPGQWLPPLEGDLVAYRNGYQVTTTEQLLQWLGPCIWEVEVRGDVVDAGDETLARSARIVAPTHWDERTARLFACDCAERALKGERRAGHEPDKRSWDAVRVARSCAEDQATIAGGTPWTVAADVAHAATEAAAWAAIEEPGWTADNVVAVAAWDATAAAWAAKAAAWASAWTDGAAARAARIAAWGGVDSAAWDAAGADAWQAEQQWQAERLLQYLDGEVR